MGYVDLNHMFVASLFKGPLGGILQAKVLLSPWRPL